MPRFFALLPAAGVGSRMAADCPKQYLPLADRNMLWHAINAFERHPSIERTFVVLSPDDDHWRRHDWSGLGRLEVLTCGGASRAETVANGLTAIAQVVAAEDWVLVHDAARPCLSNSLLDRLIGTLAGDPVGGILAVPVADTLKRQTADGHIEETVPRAGLWGAQTPQMFRYDTLARALDSAGTAVTDEASAVEALGLSPRLVMGDTTNLKVTFPPDLEIAEWLISSRKV
jgi:2-C-methyl-D-erythritol 4-phosphate cytidylyltransferase